MTATRIVCFGDSWGHGSELDFSKEKPFANHVGDLLGISQIDNFSVPGYSTFMIMKSLVDEFDNLSSNDVVLVIIPPDARWYDQDKNGKFKPIHLNSPEYGNFVKNKDISWFQFHQSLFTHTIQSLLEKKNIKYSMATNYGNIDELFLFSFPIDKSKFASSLDLTSELLGLSHGYTWSQGDFPHEDGPSEHHFRGKYFEGCRWHPNELGHKFISRLLYENLLKNYRDL